MSKKSAKNFSDTSAKKAAVTATKKKSKTPLIAAVVVFALIAVGGIYVLSSGPDRGAQLPAASTAASGSDNASGPQMAATTVSLPVSAFEDGKAHYYQHQTENGLTIRFFVLKSSDGIIRAAFDACDVCWPANKGYAQDGDVMVCRNCGRRFPSVKINEIKGGCNPAPLKRRVEGDYLIFEKTDILDGGQYFNFSNAKAEPRERAARARG